MRRSVGLITSGFGFLRIAFFEGMGDDNLLHLSDNHFTYRNASKADERENKCHYEEALLIAIFSTLLSFHQHYPQYFKQDTPLLLFLENAIPKQPILCHFPPAVPFCPFRFPYL